MTVARSGVITLDCADAAPVASFWARLLGGAVSAAVALGAVEAAHQPSPARRRILLDPAGHPFCLTTQSPSAILQ
jgi:hypothetical protein